MERSGLRQAFAAKMFGEEDGVSDFAHGLPSLSAFALHGAVGLVLREVEVALEDSLSPIYHLASLESNGEFEILGLKAGAFDLGADQNADGRDEAALEICVNVRVAVLEIEHADNTVGTDDRSAEHSLETVFGQIDEGLEARVFAGAVRDRDGLTVFGDPAGDALADRDPEMVNFFGVWVLGCAEDELVAF